MSKEKALKTNAMRMLDAAKIPHTVRTYETDGSHTGVQIAAMLGLEKESVFKTLVTRGKSGEYYVFMIPVAEELDLKKAAAAVGEKAVSMIKMKELLPLTGYIHGGCSPLGMKKQFVTCIDETAELFDRINYSGGHIGCQVETSLEDLERLIPVIHADLVV